MTFDKQTDRSHSPRGTEWFKLAPFFLAMAASDTIFHPGLSRAPLSLTLGISLPVISIPGLQLTIYSCLKGPTLFCVLFN